MQALQVAMGAAGKQVDEYKGALQWAGGLEGYRGFPRTYPEFLPKPLLQKLERMIDREIAAHTRQLLAERKRRERQRSRSRPARKSKPKWESRRRRVERQPLVEAAVT
jgi:hypothetical protein